MAFQKLLKGLVFSEEICDSGAHFLSFKVFLFLLVENLLEHTGPLILVACYETEFSLIHLVRKGAGYKVDGGDQP